jgi:hypothetical protein
MSLFSKKLTALPQLGTGNIKQTTKTFALFSKLPAELRIKILGYASEISHTIALTLGDQ